MNRNLLLLFCAAIFAATLVSFRGPLVVTRTVHDSLFVHDTVALRTDTVIQLREVPADIACPSGTRVVLTVVVSGDFARFRFRDGTEFDDRVGPHLRTGDMLCLSADSR